MVAYNIPRRHHRDDVVDAALALLDEVGLPDLTMRRLAAALDVQPSALYHHVANKQELLAALADRIVALRLSPRAESVSGEASFRREEGGSGCPGDAGDGILDWADGVRGEAARLRDSLLAYRDGAEVVSSTLSLGLGAGAAHERLVRAVSLSGVDAATASHAATTLLHFILGHVSHEQQRMQYDSLGIVSGGLAASDAGGPAGAAGIPVPAAPVVTAPAPSADDATAFFFGVDLLIAGLAARLSPPASPSYPLSAELPR